MNKILLSTIIITTLLLSHTLYAKEKIVIAGAGPSTKIIRVFFSKFSSRPGENKYNFEIPLKSIKHAGGIKHSDTNIFGRTGRPLNAKEKGTSKEEIILASVPVAFASGGNVEIRSLTIKQLEDIYLGRIKNWKELGGVDLPIKLIGREKTEAMLSVIAKTHKFFRKTKFDKIVKKDHEVTAFLKSEEGSGYLGFGAQPNFSGMNKIRIEGLDIGVNIGLVYDLKNKKHPLIKEVKEYASSQDWISTIKILKYLPETK